MPSRSEYTFEHGYPSGEAVSALYDELDYQRAVQAYVWAVPLVNAVAFMRGLVEAGVTPGEPSLLVFDQALTPKQVVMTANSEVIYAFTVLDLARTGPLVIDMPEGALGGSCDLWMRAIVDIGVGPAHGQRVLMLPPDYEGDVPDGCFVARARTRRVFVFARGIVTPGEGTGAFVDLIANAKITRVDRDDHKTRVILNGSRPVDTDWPKDARYFDYLADGLSDAVVEETDKLMYAMIAPLGLGPAAVSPPDDRARRILERAATAGAEIVATLAFANRLVVRKPWPDRRWEPITFLTTPDFETQTHIELDQRAQGFYQLVMNARYGYGMEPAPNLTAAVPGVGSFVPGAGTWYVQTYKDANGTYLDGSSLYRLTLQSDPPAKQFWSATVYDNRTRSMIDTQQQRAGVSTYSQLARNEDGSIDLYFGPDPPDGLEANWVRTIPEQGFFVMFRLYGPLEAALDGGWKLNDIEAIATT
jgi:hypothetical protein